MSTITFTVEHAGRYGHGSYGHEHVRDRLANLLDRYTMSAELADTLRGTPSDDVSEEIEALDLLNKQCEDGLAFEMVAGDLLLVPTSEMDG